jgi:hypothetical protein
MPGEEGEMFYLWVFWISIKVLQFKASGGGVRADAIWSPQICCDDA